MKTNDLLEAPSFMVGSPQFTVGVLVALASVGVILLGKT